jgi:hypothetical protein
MKRPDAANESNQIGQLVLLGFGASSNEGNLRTATIGTATVVGATAASHAPLVECMRWR